MTLPLLRAARVRQAHRLEQLKRLRLLAPRPRQTVELPPPHPGPQTQFVESDADLTFFGGAAGASKTFGLYLRFGRHLVPQAAHDPSFDPKKFAGVIFRRTVQQVRNPGGLWSDSIPVWSKIGGHPIQSSTEWHFPDGQHVKFGHMVHEASKYNHEGGQYAAIGFDQVEHFSSSQFWFLVSRSRSTCGIRPWVAATCNPQPGWLRTFLDWWIGPDGYPIEERSGQMRWMVRLGEEIIWFDDPSEWRGHPKFDEDLGPLSVTFIRGTVQDNPTLMRKDPSYISKLKSLPEEERLRLLGGCWNTHVRPEATIFPDFRPYSVSSRREVGHILQPAEIEKLNSQLSSMFLYESWDFGSGPGAATAVVWAYLHSATRMLYVWDYFAGYEESWDYYAKAAARKGVYVQRGPGAREFADRPNGRLPDRRLGDPAGRQRDSMQRSWFHNLRDYAGIKLISAKQAPDEAIMTIRELLRQRRMVFHSRCADRCSRDRRVRSLVEGVMQYRWLLRPGYEIGDGIEPDHAKPLKDGASHLVDALAGIVLDAFPRSFAAAIRIK